MKIAILFLSAFVVAVNCYPQQRQVADCQIGCPMYIMEFCGSDYKTYNSNPCFVKSQKCTQGLNDFDTFTMRHAQACTAEELAIGLAMAPPTTKGPATA